MIFLSILFMVIVFLFILLFLFISITTIVNPYYVWRITESWKANKMPQKEYFIYLRVGGIIGIIFALFFLIAYLGSFF